MSSITGARSPSPGVWTDGQGRRAGEVYHDQFGRERIVTPPTFIADDGTVTHGYEADAAFRAYIGISQPARQRNRSRESRRTRPGQRRTRRSTSAARSSDDDSGPSSEPPPLPYRIAGPVGDTRGVERAFLTILARRHPDTRWEVRS
jgi:hypothetical protein